MHVNVVVRHLGWQFEAERGTCAFQSSVFRANTFCFWFYWYNVGVSCVFASWLLAQHLIFILPAFLVLWIISVFAFCRVTEKCCAWMNVLGSERLVGMHESVCGCAWVWMWWLKGCDTFTVISSCHHAKDKGSLMNSDNLVSNLRKKCCCTLRSAPHTFDMVAGGVVWCCLSLGNL